MGWVMLSIFAIAILFTVAILGFAYGVLEICQWVRRKWNDSR